MNDQRKTCPSATCEPGAKVIGVVNGSGLVDLLEKPFPVDTDFTAEANKGRQPEQRFRFANRCVQTGCKQWSSGACGVISKIVKAMEQDEQVQPALPPCGIRNTCRWFFQEGPKACAVCPLIVTDNIG